MSRQHTHHHQKRLKFKPNQQAVPTENLRHNSLYRKRMKILPLDKNISMHRLFREINLEKNELFQTQINQNSHLDLHLGKNSTKKRKNISKSIVVCEPKTKTKLQFSAKHRGFFIQSVIENKNSRTVILNRSEDVPCGH